MIDAGSYVDIFYFGTFQKLRLSIDNLTPMTSLLTMLTDDYILPLNIVNLHVTFEDKPYSKIIWLSLW